MFFCTPVSSLPDDRKQHRPINGWDPCATRRSERFRSRSPRDRPGPISDASVATTGVVLWWAYGTVALLNISMFSFAINYTSDRRHGSSSPSHSTFQPRSCLGIFQRRFWREDILHMQTHSVVFIILSNPHDYDHNCAVGPCTLGKSIGTHFWWISLTKYVACDVQVHSNLSIRALDKLVHKVSLM